jgi:hypothetical protein
VLESSPHHPLLAHLHHRRCPCRLVAPPAPIIVDEHATSLANRCTLAQCPPCFYGCRDKNLHPGPKLNKLTRHPRHHTPPLTTAGDTLATIPHRPLRRHAPAMSLLCLSLMPQSITVALSPPMGNPQTGKLGSIAHGSHASPIV